MLFTSMLLVELFLRWKRSLSRVIQHNCLAPFNSHIELFFFYWMTFENIWLYRPRLATCFLNSCISNLRMGSSGLCSGILQSRRAYKGKCLSLHLLGVSDNEKLKWKQCNVRRSSSTERWPTWQRPPLGKAMGPFMNEQWTSWLAIY